MKVECPPPPPPRAVDGDETAKKLKDTDILKTLKKKKNGDAPEQMFLLIFVICVFLWKLYCSGLERKFRAENGGLKNGTYPIICTYMEVHPPPPRDWIAKKHHSWLFTTHFLHQYIFDFEVRLV